MGSGQLASWAEGLGGTTLFGLGRLILRLVLRRWLRPFRISSSNRLELQRLRLLHRSLSCINPCLPCLQQLRILLQNTLILHVVLIYRIAPFRSRLKMRITLCLLLFRTPGSNLFLKAFFLLHKRLKARVTCRFNLFQLLPESLISCSGIWSPNARSTFLRM